MYVTCFLSCIACPADKRQFFQHRMLQFIEKKRTEARVEPEPERSSDSEESRDPAAEPRLKTPAKVAIYWMFDELDVSPMDRQLSSEEMSSFLTEVQREVDPRACAESMKSYCDYNEDGMISLSEWCWCSGLDNSKFLMNIGISAEVVYALYCLYVDGRQLLFFATCGRTCLVCSPLVKVCSLSLSIVCLLRSMHSGKGEVLPGQFAEVHVPEER